MGAAGVKRELAIAAIMLGAVAALPLSGDAYALRLGTTALLYAVLAMSWNFIGGMTGYPSFASAAFFGLGAYAGAIAQTSGMPMGFAWAFAGIVALVFAGLLGLALLRLRGHYFAIASLVVAEVLREVANSATDLTGGGMGLNLPVMSGMSIQGQAVLFFYAMLATAALNFAAMLVTAHSRLGFGLRCIQQNESAADMIGVNTTLYASWVNYIEPPDVFDVLYSVKAIVMVLLGGAGSLFGPLIGATVFLGLEELVWRNLLQIHTGILGLLIVLLVLFLPRGLLSLSRRRWKVAS